MSLRTVRRRPRVRDVLVAVVMVVLASACTAGPSPTGVSPLSSARILDQQRVDDRLVELAVDAPGVGRTSIRLLLPAGFDADPGRRWPVLYLLHGGGGDFTDWTDSSDVEGMTSALDVIVAMPDSGPGATYVDWAYDGPNGRPQYETWITELLPDLLAREFRADDRAVIAGLSAGGFGAMSYAARHPDRYRAVATFSGNLDTRDGDTIGPWLSAVPTLALDGAFPLGDPLTEEVRWRGHNPLDLVPNLAGVDIFVSNGNGQIGELSGPQELTDFLWLESSTERRGLAFVARAAELGIPVTTDFYGDGTHSFPWWNRELGRALPMLMAALDRVRPAPDSFTYRSVEPRFSVWGWTFEVSDRAEPAFTDVAIDGHGLSVSGNGTVRVTTPPDLVAGAQYLVAGEVVTAGADGRVTFGVDLPDNAEPYSIDVDPPGPRPTGPAAQVDIVAVP